MPRSQGQGHTDSPAITDALVAKAARREANAKTTGWGPQPRGSTQTKATPTLLLPAPYVTLEAGKRGKPFKKGEI